MRSRAPVRPIAIAAAFGAAHGAISASVLALGYPHEDAYILFKYARNLARGLGVVFYEGGPRAEGATDFLWLLALAAFARLGIDAAIAAAMLNAVAFGVVVARLRSFWDQFATAPSAPRARRAVTIVAGALLLVHPLSAAGAVGFSATLYAALAFELYRRLATERLQHVPAFALLLGLVRPDGVLLGAAAVVLAMLRAPDREARRALLARSVVGGALGAAYFAARARYFGAVLPLPLVVKSHYEGLPPGVVELLDWGAATLLPMGLAFAVLSYVFASAATLPRSVALALVPFAVHVLGFVPSFPSQNIANRFQAPATLALFAALTLFGVRSLGEPSAWRVRMTPRRGAVFVAACLSLVTITQAIIGVRAVKEALAPDYMNPFSVELGRIARARSESGGPALRVASTEAGRVLYWTEGPVLDLVGLNTPETAGSPPSRALLAKFDADVFMLHHASGMHEDGMESGRREDVFPLERPLASYVFPWNARLLARDLPSYAVLRVDNVRAAPIATAAFIDEHSGEYEVVAARFRARFARLHVYAIKKNLPEREAILTALREAHDEARHGSHISALAGAR